MHYPTMINQTYNTALFIMASLSPKVKDSIDLELYRASADSDQATEQFICDDALLILLRELGDLGVILTVDPAEILQSTETLFDFLHFVSYLFPNTLYTHLKTQPLLFSCVTAIMDGSLGGHETALQIYLSELGGLDGQIALASDLTDTVDKYYSSIQQSEVFTDYMRNLIDTLLHQRLAVESDVQSHDAYRTQIRALIVRLSDAVNLFTGTARYDMLTKLQAMIISDLTSAAQYLDYYYLFCVDRASLPDDLVSSYDQKWYYYRVSHSWCPDYFTTRKTQPLPAQVMMMYCFLYACSPLKAQYDKEQSVLQTLYPLPEADGLISTLYTRVAL